MALSSALIKSRRTAKHKTKDRLQVIAFCLRQTWFALPVQSVRKVIPLGAIYGVTQRGHVGLTRYQNQEIPVIDVEERIFGATPTPTSTSSALALTNTLSSATLEQQRCLLVIPSSQELIGLPLNFQPTLRRVPQSAFSLLSPTYLNDSNIRCVNALIMLDPDEPPLFWLDLNQLLQSQANLLPGTPPANEDTVPF
ncbi:MAG: chemotaxis protein CheW [Cyanothece sp. SIO1E1]|nr:chemotaxis protein CheW [Cyanothece sp. SIO1E1]